MALNQNSIITLKLTSSSPPPPRTEVTYSSSNQIIIEQEPIFLFELRFSYKFEKWLRNFDGDWTLIQSIPIAPSSSHFFKFRPCYLFDPSPTCYINFLDGFLSDFIFDASLCSILVNEIASFLTSLANDLSSFGFSAVAEVETTNEELLDTEEILNSIMGTAATATDDGDLVVPPSRRGASRSAIRRLKKKGKFYGGKSSGSDEFSGDCVICLEELSGAVKSMIKLPCNHLFHEQCIFKWLKDQNSCPICRREA